MSNAKTSQVVEHQTQSIQPVASALPRAELASSSVGGTLPRSEVLQRAQYWADRGFTYQGANAPDSSGKNYRTDCSGLVSNAWHLSDSLTTDVFLANARNNRASMRVIGLDELQPGDAMVRDNDGPGSDGHMELFASWVNSSNHRQGANVYSFNSTGETVRTPFGLSNRGNRGFDAWSELVTYTAIRYGNVTDDRAPASRPHVSSGRNGVLYAVQSNGALLWYRHLDPTGGAMTWASAGREIGDGWNMFTAVIAAGDGVLYGVQPSGDLLWYRHLDPTGGTVTWANSGGGSTIGTGWQMFHTVIAAGNGVLYGIQPNGDLLWYRHLDPTGGAATWANGGASTTAGTGWNGFLW